MKAKRFGLISISLIVMAFLLTLGHLSWQAMQSVVAVEPPKLILGKEKE